MLFTHGLAVPLGGFFFETLKAVFITLVFPSVEHLLGAKVACQNLLQRFRIDNFLFKRNIRKTYCDRKFHVFPCLASVAGCCLFAPTIALVTCFPRLGTGCYTSKF